MEALEVRHVLGPGGQVRAASFIFVIVAAGSVELTHSSWETVLSLRSERRFMKPAVQTLRREL